MTQRTTLEQRTAMCGLADPWQYLGWCLEWQNIEQGSLPRQELTRQDHYPADETYWGRIPRRERSAA